MDFRTLDSVVVNNIYSDKYAQAPPPVNKSIIKRKSQDQYNYDKIKFSPSHSELNLQGSASRNSMIEKQYQSQNNTQVSNLKQAILNMIPTFSQGASISSHSNHSSGSKTPKQSNLPSTRFTTLEAQYQEIKALIQQLDYRVKQTERKAGLQKFYSDRLERIENSFFKRFAEIEQKILRIEISQVTANNKTVRANADAPSSQLNKSPSSDSIDDFEDFTSEEEDQISKDYKNTPLTTPLNKIGKSSQKYCEDFENEEIKNDAALYLGAVHNRIKSFSSLNNNIQFTVIAQQDSSSLQSTYNNDRMQSLNEIYQQIIESSQEKMLKFEYNEEPIQHTILQKITERVADEEFTSRSHQKQQYPKQYHTYYNDIDKMLQRDSFVSSPSSKYVRDDVGETIHQLEFTIAEEDQEQIMLTLKKITSGLSYKDGSNYKNYELTMKENFTQEFDSGPMKQRESQVQEQMKDQQIECQKSIASLISMNSNQTINSFCTNKETQLMPSNLQCQIQEAPSPSQQQSAILEEMNKTFKDSDSLKYGVNGEWLRDYCRFIDIDIAMLKSQNQPQLLLKESSSTQLMEEKLQNLENQIMINYQIDQKIKSSTLLNTHNNVFTKTQNLGSKQHHFNNNDRETPDFMMQPTNPNHNMAESRYKIHNQLLINDLGYLKSELILDKDFYFINEGIWTLFQQWGFEIDVEIMVK